MNKLFKWGFILCFALVLVGAGFVAAAVIQQYMHPSTAHGQTVELTAYLDGELWENNTAIDWGDVESDTAYWCYLNVTNTGQLNCTVSMTTTNLPAGWTQTWTANNTFLESNEWANGTLTITTATVEAITYNWDTIIKATQTT